MKATVTMLAVALWAGGAAPAHAGRSVRCCLAVQLAPDAPRRCVVAVLHVRGVVGAKQLCRLSGGHPVRRGAGCVCGAAVAGVDVGG